MEDRILIKRVIHFEDLHKVYRLAHDSFYMAGLCEYHPRQMMIHYPGQDVIPETEIFLVLKNDIPVGSISFTIDSCYGLMLDHGFKEQIDRCRRFYGKVASIWRLIVHPDHQNDLRILRKLMGAIGVCVLKYQIPVFFATFSPEHARLYEKIFRAEKAGHGTDNNEMIRSEHSEVILMKFYPDKIPEKWYSLKEEEILL